MIRGSKVNNPAYAANCLWRGLQLLFSPALRRYLLIPLFINVVLYSLAFAVGYHAVAVLLAQFIPDWLSWLQWIVWPLFFMGFLIAGFFTFTLFANLLAAPYYGQLAAKTVAIVSGQPAAVAEQPWDRLIVGELRRLGYLLLRLLPLIAVSLVPIVNLLAPLLWTAFGAWGMAVEFMAYPLELQGKDFVAQRQWQKNARLAVLSFGGLVAAGFTVPLLNCVLGPAAVIGATLYVYEL